MINLINIFFISNIDVLTTMNASYMYIKFTQESYH